MKKLPKRLQPFFGPQAREMLSALVVPAAQELEVMNLFALNRLARRIEDKVEDSDARNIFSIENLHEYPKIQRVFTYRNRRVLRAALASPEWKKLVARNRILKNVWHVSIPSREETIQIELPQRIAEKAVRRVFSSYEDGLSGFFSLVTLSPRGLIKSLNLWETEDRDLFYQCFLGLSLRERAGGSPLLSATIFAPGTVLRGKDRRWYVVSPYKDSKRWVPLAH